MDPSLAELQAACATVHALMPPTPQYRWPLLGQSLGCECWVKHENHTPVGAFKIRGGIHFFDQLMRRGPKPRGVVSATRGNHGQSVAYAAARHGIAATIFVPRANSREKNAAMRALGAQLVEQGDDFQAAREAAAEFAQQQELLMLPSFHRDLVVGVASYAMELFDALRDLDVVYVPIGLGSGACGVIAARDALGLDTDVVGVVSTQAPAYALSLAQGRPVSHAVSTELADGMACRTPEPQALQWLARGLARVVSVSDGDIAAAMRLLYETTHQVAEGAGAAALAAAWTERDQLAGRRVALVLSGGNVDRETYARVLNQPS